MQPYGYDRHTYKYIYLFSLQSIGISDRELLITISVITFFSRNLCVCCDGDHDVLNHDTNNTSYECECNKGPARRYTRITRVARKVAHQNSLVNLPNCNYSIPL